MLPTFRSSLSRRSTSARRRSSSAIRTVMSTVSAIFGTSLRFRSGRETYAQPVAFELGPLRRGIGQDARQDEVAAPRPDLQDQLVGVARQLHVLPRG